MIGKCNTGGGENLTTQLNNQDAIITELEAKVQSVSGVDMATPVNEQTVTIEDIQEALVDKGAVNQVELTVTPGKDSQEYNPDYGTLYSKVTVNGDSDLVAENIKQGIDIFGVVGSMIEGASGIDYGTFTITSSYQSSVTVAHNLGVTPTHILAVLSQGFSVINPSCCNFIYKGTSANALVYRGNQWEIITTGNHTGAGVDLISFGLENAYFEPNKLYYWIAIA